MEKRGILWLFGYMVVVGSLMLYIAIMVVTVDPFFHYHRPDTQNYYYSIDNERSQNDGIIRHFEYDAIITGSSMIENFKTTEANEIFKANFIKVPSSGATYKELYNMVSKALKREQVPRIIIIGLDMNRFFDEANSLRTELGEYPNYLYDNLMLNDVKYLFNRDVIFNRVFVMKEQKNGPGFKPGITSFDQYKEWGELFQYGSQAVLSDKDFDLERTLSAASDEKKLTEREKKSIIQNTAENITSLAVESQDTMFYCFFPPYSAVWWGERVQKGELNRQIEAERTVIEELLKTENIKLYSFNCVKDIVTDLNHYKDKVHYGPWINTLMLQWMKDERGLLTAENYQSYLEEERAFFTSFDYSLLFDQADYSDDSQAESAMERLGSEKLT